MRINHQDINWLRNTFPNLIFDPKKQIIAGELDFCAAYNKNTKALLVEGYNYDYGSLRKTNLGLCDVFEIEIKLNNTSSLSEVWPRIYEVGGRRESISNRLGIQPLDLHFYTQDQACCLGISYTPIKANNIQEFIYHIVIPFFYRLAYVERFGLQAAREDLWGEYSHGESGLLEYIEEMLKIKSLNVGRNEPCPCGNGKKYKRCHWYEVEATISRLNLQA